MDYFAELGIDECRSNCDKYSRWTADVVAARETGSMNAQRILILVSPGKTAKDLLQ